MAYNEKLGSTSPQVLLKNAINLDKLVNDRESESLPDRFDVLRRTWFGMEKAHDRQMQSQENRFDTFIASSGYDVIGDYTSGPLKIEEYNQLIRYNNELYKLTAATDIPFTAAGNTDETWTGTDAAHFVSVGDAALRQNLGSDEEGLGADLVNTVLDISVGKYIQNASPRISDYKVTKGADATLAFAKAFAKAAETTGVVIVDVSCLLTSTVVPENITVRISDYVTVTHPDNAPGHMFILSDGAVIKGNNKKGRLRGNSANQSSIRRCISAVGVTGAGVDGVDIRDFNSYGAYFENCEDTFCKNTTIRDITGGAVETAAGQYVTNCVNHESAFNDIRDTGSNGIKFRADSGGLTTGCSSTNDRIYRTGFIGIAHSRVRDHRTVNAYCVDCVDNGLDMNGSQNCWFIGCMSVRCLDGFYMGENGINNCHVIDCTARDCRRAGVGCMGSLVMCSVQNPAIDGCGSGIYLSGFLSFKISCGSIINSVKGEYFDNEAGEIKTSTGIGIHIQSDLTSLPACTNPDIQGVTFMNNAGYDLALGNAGAIGSLQFLNNTFLDSAGDGKIYYGSATLSDPIIGNNIGYITSRTQTYNLAGDGTTVEFTLSLSQEVADVNYRIVSVVPDWMTTVRYLDNTKGTAYFGITFGSAPPTGTRRLNVTFERLRPAH